MRLFISREAFDDVLGGTTKWLRTGQAIDSAPSLPAAVTHSVGDSLTFRRGTARDLATETMIGRRRYHLVVAATRGVVRVEVGSGLTPLAPYDDLSDRQPFAGSGEVVEVPEGGILIVGIDEAARIQPDPDASAVALHVTVEGATFHNK